MIFSVWWLLRFILQVFVYLLPVHIHPLPVLNFNLLYALTSNNFNEIDCSCRSVKECRLCAQKAKNHVLFTWIPYCAALHRTSYLLAFEYLTFSAHNTIVDYNVHVRMLHECADVFVSVCYHNYDALKLAFMPWFCLFATITHNKNVNSSG